ncbi:MAG: hypothetical protein CMI32_05710 [Opitutales bacterium]|jgi:DNA primase large subunit|nr:hypothetical protein [Opitutales bacterium]MDP6010586.1 hypothetical protein [Candidatus Poseidoniaceae archaeon]MDP7202851.1 hypothetical protein [Candidatus Poseidoniaceae archaeon]
MPLPFEVPPIEDEVTLARYPFLPQSAPWIHKLTQKEGIDMDVLIDSEMMEDSRRRGRLRLVESIANEGGVDAMAMRDIHTPGGRLLEAISFTYARLVACASDQDIVLSKWAQAEAERAERLLAADTATIEKVAMTYLSKVRKKDSALVRDSTAIRGVWEIGIADFIELVPGITGPRWRLPNQELKRGWITLYEEVNYSSQAKLARLLRQRIKDEILKDARLKVKNINDELALRLSEATTMVVGLLQHKSDENLELSGVQVDDWPPCLKKAVAELDQGVNVNHFGRLFLASMASTIGLPQENCVEFFHNAPDFNSETTGYQVSHVYDREYTPAGCGKLKLNARCAMRPGEDRLCDQPWMDHPLKYLRAKQRSRKRYDEEAEKRDESDDGNSESRDGS